MTNFEDKYFKQYKFTKEQVGRYFNNSVRDFEIAKESKRNEVKFNYSYTSLIKSGIALLAGVGNVKVRSIPGHHIKIIEKMSEIMNDDSILTIGNSMRMKRNEDFYGEGIFVSEKEANEYMEFIKAVIERVGKKLRCDNK